LDIDRIVSELRSERDRIERAISALLRGVGLMLSANGSKLRGRPSGRGKGLTAAGRKRLSDAMKARWTARRVQPALNVAQTQKHGRKRRRMSAAGRKRIAEAMRKRWAEKRKAAFKNGAELNRRIKR